MDVHAPGRQPGTKRNKLASGLAPLLLAGLVLALAGLALALAGLALAGLGLALAGWLWLWLAWLWLWVAGSGSGWPGSGSRWPGSGFRWPGSGSGWLALALALNMMEFWIFREFYDFVVVPFGTKQTPSGVALGWWLA